MRQNFKDLPLWLGFLGLQRYDFPSSSSSYRTFASPVLPTVGVPHAECLDTVDPMMQQCSLEGLGKAG
jgi:hypothetical protein